MDRTISSGPENDQRNHRLQPPNHQIACIHKKSKTQKSFPPPENLANLLAKIVKRFAPFLSDSFRTLPEHREKGKLYYSAPHLIWSGILLFLLLLKSRKQYRRERYSPQFLKNLLLLSKSNEQSAADPDTLANFLKNLPSRHLELIPSQLVNHLIRIKALDDYRFWGHFLIAIDGTGIHTFKQRHCQHCLHKTTKNGEILYYHHVLEAKLVTQNGFAFSVASEFIRNPCAFPSVQDCEYNAFKRLVLKLKRYFPRLPICLLLDGLYHKTPTFEICQRFSWKYVITFKSGSMPSFYKEVWKEKQSKLDNRKTLETTNSIQRFSWVNFMEYQGHLLNIIFCNEFIPNRKKVRDFAWSTNFHELNRSNVEKIANHAGRLRWKIENEGFNTQKNGGYELEHAYSLDNNASANWYYLMQIAHALNQLLHKSNLFTHFDKQIGSLRNLAKLLTEDLRGKVIDLLSVVQPFQIRFNTS